MRGSLAQAFVACATSFDILRLEDATGSRKEITMKRKLAFALISAATLAVSPAFAEGEAAPAATETTTTTTAAAAPAAEGAKEQKGVEIGLRVGYGIPLGDAAKDVKLGDSIKGQIPIRLDAGYRVTSNIYVGLYFSYGIAMINKDKVKGCDVADCSASTINFGVMGAYHISPAESMDPWIGLGLGLENVTQKVSLGGNSASSTIKGLTFLDIQAGLDFKATPNLLVGPVVSFALGQYSSVSTDAGSADITDKGMHEWLTIGVRGAYGIW
jgi:opacity protein-like surface antigen